MNVANQNASSADLLFEILKVPQMGEWDDFVLSHPEPHHEQLALWGALKARQGWTSTCLVARRDGKIVGGAQLLIRRIARFFRVGYVCRGPLLSDVVEPGMFVDQLKRLAARQRLTYLAVSLPYLADSMAAAMTEGQFSRRPEKLPPAVWAKATVVVDLQGSLEAILAQMWPSKRQQIRRGLKGDIVVRHGGAAEIPVFTELVEALCRRRGTASNIPGGEYMNDFWTSCSKQGLLKLLIAEHESQPVCAMLLTACGDWVRAWRFGWSGEFAKMYPNDLLYWEAIRWAKENGYRYFDALGIDHRDARELLAGRKRSDPFHCQITFFKVGLGGRVILLPGEFCYFPNRLTRGFFNSIGAPLLESRLVARLGNRLIAG